MPLEYKTLKFENSQAGIKAKNKSAEQLAADGWRIVSEQIDPGHMKGEQACCLATICLPLGFAAGRTTGTIMVTLGRDSVICPDCRANNPANARFCKGCGKQIVSSS